MYKIIDYHTGKKPNHHLIDEVYYNELDAKTAKNVYLNTMLRDGTIHNNLLIIEKV